MIPFADVSIVVQGLFGIAVSALLFACIALTVLEVQQKRWKKLVFLIPMIVLLYASAQCIAYINTQHLSSSWLLLVLIQLFGRLPLIVLLIFLLVLTAVICLLFYESQQWKHQHITAVSIKEAVDDMSAGLCIYEDSGKVVLKNIAMEKVCRALTGTALLNGHEFAGQVQAVQQSLDSKPIVMLADGGTLSFSESHIVEDGKSWHVMTAFDITEEYQKIRILSEQQKQVVALNQKLVAYGKEMVSSITAKEILNAKMKIHDEFGVNLLAAKHYILNGGTPQEAEALKTSLCRNVDYLRHEGVRPETDEYTVLLKTAENLGMHVHVSGVFPKQPAMRHLLVSAMNECLTNTIRHAHGDTLRVAIHQSDTSIAAVFTNNGTQPMSPIVEKGGLTFLRQLIEKAGGTMTIQVKPTFLLEIKLPIANVGGEEIPCIVY